MNLLILLIAAILGWVTGAVFEHKNRVFIEGFIVGVFLGPIGVLIALCLAPVSPKVYEEIEEYKKQIRDFKLRRKI